MRVLHVAESIKGGCGTYLDQIVPEQARDCAVRVIVPDAHVEQIGRIAPDHIVTFSAGERSLASLRALASTIRREVAAFRPDVVHLHSTFAGLVGRPLLAVRRRRPRIVYCAHGWAFDMDRAGWKLNAVARLERTLSPLADRIIAISDYERRRGLEIGIASDRIVTVHNGLINAPIRSAPVERSTKRRVLFIGRLDRQKGYDLLLDAVAPLGNVLELRMVGAAVVGDQKIGQALPAHVTHLGWQGPDRIAAELAWADLVVIPSRWEGFGLVALEAMRAGRAVVASAVGGLPEVVEDGVTGRLLPVGDIEVLRTALVTLDAPTLATMGVEGRRRFEARFTVDRTVAGLRAVYESNR